MCRKKKWLFAKKPKNFQVIPAEVFCDEALAGFSDVSGTFLLLI